MISFQCYILYILYNFKAKGNFAFSFVLWTKCVFIVNILNLQLLEISFIETDIEEDGTCSFDALQLNVGSEVVSYN